MGRTDDPRIEKLENNIAVTLGALYALDDIRLMLNGQRRRGFMDQESFEQATVQLDAIEAGLEMAREYLRDERNDNGRRMAG